jgi:hypothetical protein
VVRAKIAAITALPRFWSWVIDRIEYSVTSLRLAILDWIYGPEIPTPADREREAQKERLRQAFPLIEIDGKGRKG